MVVFRRVMLVCVGVFGSDVGVPGVVYGIGVMACAGQVVCDACCVSCRGEGDGIWRC